MKEVIIPRLSVFVSPRHLQHGGPKRNVSHKLRYHLYLAPCNEQLKDGIAFAYGDSVTDATITGAGREPAEVVETHVKGVSL